MNASIPESSRAVGPVAQFALLIVPFVMNGFLRRLCAGRLGGAGARPAQLVARGRRRGDVGRAGHARRTRSLVIAFTRLCGGPWRHPLVVSSVLHALFALLVAAAIVVIARPVSAETRGQLRYRRTWFALGVALLAAVVGGSLASLPAPAEGDDAARQVAAPRCLRRADALVRASLPLAARPTDARRSLWPRSASAWSTSRT